MRKRLTFCSLIVAVVGLCSALLIYLTAGEGADGGEGFEIVMVDGKAYPIPLADTKMYRRELQRFGGKMALLLDDLNRWFASLWRGKSLAVTVVWITAFVSLALFLLARAMPPDPEPGVRAEDDRDKAG
ncbi:MAG: hypothetical protein E6H49_03945 [Betaproteobacteria bacterium]|nr:MAG: hypothetical protein E6H49_03945 [Betaproteobacteria bacterium]